MTAVIAGEEEWAIRFNELLIGTIVVSRGLVFRIDNGTGNPRTEVEWILPQFMYIG
jgi:hypothetical protein